MTENEPLSAEVIQRIEELKKPPQIEYTHGQKIARVIGWACSLIAVAALLVAVYATQKAWSTANCVNSVLGNRAPTTQADQTAHIAWAQSLAKVLTDTSRAQQLADYKAFVVETGEYVRTLSQDQAFRDRHPLGQC